MNSVESYELSSPISTKKEKSKAFHEMTSNNTSGCGFKAIHSTNGDENCSMDNHSD